MAKKVYDLEAEERERLREAEDRHYKAQLLKEVTELRREIQTMWKFAGMTVH